MSEEICASCGFEEYLHPAKYCKIEGIRRVDKICKKFKPKKEETLAENQICEKCGREYDGKYPCLCGSEKFILKEEIGKGILK